MTDILIAGIVSIFLIISFIITALNIEAIKKLNQKQVKQNDEMIYLLKRHGGQMTGEGKVRAFDQLQKNHRENPTPNRVISFWDSDTLKKFC